MAQLTRNEILFQTQSLSVPASDLVRITFNDRTVRPIIDPFTDRPELETLAVDATVTILRFGREEPLYTTQAIGRATFDRTRQRFATVRAQRDAQDRVARILATQIATQIAVFYRTPRAAPAQ